MSDPLYVLVGLDEDGERTALSYYESANRWIALCAALRDRLNWQNAVGTIHEDTRFHSFEVEKVR